MGDIDPLGSPPLFEADQIITRQDLVDCYSAIKDLRDSTTNRGDRQRLNGALEGIVAVIDWFDKGKPRQFGV